MAQELCYSGCDRILLQKERGTVLINISYLCDSVKERTCTSNFSIYTHLLFPGGFFVVVDVFGVFCGWFGFFCGFLPFVLFCLVCCFLFCFVFSIDYATEVQDMLSLQWCLDGTLYYIAHCNCEAGWVRVDKL